MDPVITFGAILGALIGSIGYVLFYAMVRPVMHYRRIKKQISHLLPAENPPNTDSDLRRKALEISDRLHDCYEEKLPLWYKQLLIRRNETPAQAVNSLQKLATVRNPEKAASLAAHIHRLLHLAP